MLLLAGDASAFTRNGHDWSESYAAVLKAFRALECDSAIFEGEMIVQDDHGRSDFQAFQRAVRGGSEPMIFMGFDLLHLDGRDLRRRPLYERRELLRDLLGPNDSRSCIQFSDDVVGDGRELLRAAEAAGLEGIVSKRVKSSYRSGRSRDWLKVKCFAEDEFVVIGTAKGDRAPVALLARETERGLEYAGVAMVTLPQPDRDRFWSYSDALKIPRPGIPMPKMKETGWMTPEVRVRAKYLRGEEKLRHATVSALLS